MEIDGIEKNMSIDRLSLTARYDKTLTETPLRNSTTSNGSAGEFADEYVVEKIVVHDETDRRLQYCIRWYSYPPDEDTAEPVAGAPQHFITRYLTRRE